MAAWKRNISISTLGSFRRDFRLEDLEVTGDPGVVVSTSGTTTGTPKMLVVPWAAVQERCQNLGSAFDAADIAVTLPLLPSGYTAGAISSRLAVLWNGGKIVQWSVHSRADPFNEAVDDYGVTCVFTKPSIMRRICERHDVPTKATLRAIILVNEPLTAEDWQTFTDRFGARVITCYGASEFGPIALSDGSKPENGRIGPILQGVEARIVDGILHVRGGCMASFYFDGSPVPTLADGWYDTGDLADIVDGSLYIYGRA